MAICLGAVFADAIRKRLLLALCLGALFAAPANAAFINVNDVAFGTITISFGDFDNGGFSIDGGAPASNGTLTFADGVQHTFTGNFVQNNPTSPMVNILFAIPGSPGSVTSFLRITNPSLGSVTGNFGGFTGATYFATGLATQLQGTTGGGAVTNLTASMASEAVPEPTTMLLLGISAMAFARRYRRS